MFSITEIKEHLTAMGHSGTLNKVRNQPALFERAANNVVMFIDPLDTKRIAPLTSLVHSQVYNLALPSDFKKPIDLFPQGDRTQADDAHRQFSKNFDLRKALTEKTIAITSNDGTKFMRVNWSVRTPKVLNTMNSYNGNGSWLAVGGASGIRTNTIYYFSGSGSVEFDLAASGDGISNIGMTSLDMTDEDEVADVYFEFYVGSAADLAKIISVTAIWGNDITTKYWTGVAQTAQADGTAFQLGWNIVKFPWSTATETGVVVPTAIDSFKITFVTTGAINNLRVDNIIFAIGKVFNMEYYSKYLFRNSSGTWLSRYTSDDDMCVLDNEAINIFLYELVKAAAHQVEGEDSAADIEFCDSMLHTKFFKGRMVGEPGLYDKYRGIHPTEEKKAVKKYFNLARR